MLLRIRKCSQHDYIIEKEPRWYWPFWSKIGHAHRLKDAEELVQLYEKFGRIDIVGEYVITE